MALDEALLEVATRCAGPAASLLRFYTWPEPAVTIGRFQNAHGSPDLVRCAALGIPLIRRPTGGRAVYHGQDLTYSLLLPELALPDRSIRGSYGILLSAFSRGMARLGISAQVGEGPCPGPRSAADCFLHAAPMDLTVQGRKVVGSAQARRGGWMLQQGSVQLWSGDRPAAFPRPADVTPVADGYSISHNRISRDQVRQSLTEELGLLLGRPFSPVGLQEEEEALASTLSTLKYSTDAWNLCGKDPLCSLDS